MPINVPGENRSDSATVADEAAAEANDGNIFSRMWNGYEDAVYGASASVYNWFVDDENEITSDDVRATDQNISAKAGEVVTEFASDTIDMNALLLKGEFSEYGARVGHRAVALADGAVDGAFGLGALAATAGDAVVNNAPRLVGNGPTWGEDHSSWDTFEKVNGWDDAGLGWVYDKADYELQTEGVYGSLNVAGSIIGGGGAFGQGAKLTARGARSMAGGFRKATKEGMEETVEKGTKKTATPGGNTAGTTGKEGVEETAETTTRRVFTPGNSTARASTKEAAEETAEAGAKRTAAPNANTASTTAKEGMEEAAEATGKKSFAGRAVDVMAGRTPKGIYRNKNYSVSDKLTELSRADELGMDPGKAKKFTDRLINDVGAGRATIKPSEIRNLERSGDFSEDLMKNLRSAQTSSQTAVGRLDYKAHHLGDTFRNAIGGGGNAIATSLGIAKDVTLAPLTAAKWAISNPLKLSSYPKLATVWGGVAADNYAFDGAGRDLLGDGYGKLYRGIGKGVDTVTGTEISNVTTDFAAAAVDPDQTVPGELRENGNHLLAAGLERVPFVGGEHTPIDKKPQDNPAADNNSEMATTGPAARNGDGKTSVMDSFSTAAAGLDIDFNDMSMVNYVQIGLGIIAAWTGFIEGNMMGGALLGALAVGLQPAMKLMDDWAESNGIDLVPDQWHTPESKNAYAGLSL